jgi:hypothetical protein
VSAAAVYLDACGFREDAREIRKLESSHGFRRSEVLGFLLDRQQATNTYYAYTPVFSYSRIFLGRRFSEIGVIGRSSILLHELTHIRRHCRRLLRGIPRSADEAEAYRRQYLTHSKIGLSPASSDAIVYWDMMIGVFTYSLPRYPELARRSEVRQALSIANWR